MKIYYVHNGSEQEGPFTLNELRTKNLTTDTPIWYEGLSGWTIAEKVYELKDMFSTSVQVPDGVAQTFPPDFYSETKKRSPRKIVFYVFLILIIIIIGFVALDLLDRYGKQYRVQSGEELETTASVVSL